MSKKLDKDNPNRWVLITNENEGADSLFSFGNGGEQGVTIVETGQPNLVSFFTEEELEEAVNTIALDPAYYKNAMCPSSRFPRCTGRARLGEAHRPPAPRR